MKPTPHDAREALLSTVANITADLLAERVKGDTLSDAATRFPRRYNELMEALSNVAAKPGPKHTPVVFSTITPAEAQEELARAGETLAAIGKLTGWDNRTMTLLEHVQQMPMGQLNANLADRADKLERSVRWVLGEHADGFPEQPPAEDGRIVDKFWWRRELRARAFG